MIKINFMKNESFSDISVDKADMSSKNVTKEPLLKPSLFSKCIKKEKKIFKISKEIRQKV